jgi:hypothetical protein
MNVPLPRVHDDAVLAGVKATPSGWPSASPDPPAPGDAHQQRPRAEQETDPTNSGLHGFRGLPALSKISMFRLPG